MENITLGLHQSQKESQVGEDSAESQVLAWGLHGQGYALVRIGLLDEAASKLLKALELHKNIPNDQYFIIASGDLGECYLRQGKLELALEVLEKSVLIVIEKGLRDYGVTWVRNNLAEVYLTAARQATTEQERRLWLNKAQIACKAALKHSKKFMVGKPKAARLQGEYEWLIGKPKLAQKWWQESLDVATEMGARYEAGMTHLTMGRYLRARVHLEQARDIFAALEAKWDWAQAQSLLEQ